MARTIAQIQQAIVDQIQADPVLSVKLTSTSKVAVWLLLTWVVAICMWVTENLYDSAKAEVAATIQAQKLNTLSWYETHVKQFQYGDSLPQDTDVYPVIDVSKQIIAFAAAVEQANMIRIKMAVNNAGVLGPMTDLQVTAVNTYIGRWKTAGVRVVGTSNVADNLRVSTTIYYDPLVLDGTGKRLDGTNDTPVLSAVNAYLSSLGFNGVFVFNNMIAAIQAVDGVTIGEVDYCAAQYGALPYIVIPAFYTPDAGYMLLDANYFTTNTNYEAYGVI